MNLLMPVEKVIFQYSIGNSIVNAALDDLCTAIADRSDCGFPAYLHRNFCTLELTLPFAVLSGCTSVFHTFLKHLNYFSVIDLLTLIVTTNRCYPIQRFLPGNLKWPALS